MNNNAEYRFFKILIIINTLVLFTGAFWPDHVYCMKKVARGQNFIKNTDKGESSGCSNIVYTKEGAFSSKEEDCSRHAPVKGYAPGEVLVKFREGVNVKEARENINKIRKQAVNIMQKRGGKGAGLKIAKEFSNLSHIGKKQLMKLKSDLSVSETINILKNNPDVEVVSPN